MTASGSARTLVVPGEAACMYERVLGCAPEARR